MTALDILLDLVLFSVLAAGMWWTGTRSLTTDEGVSHESAAEPDVALDCDACGGSLTTLDEYPHDGSTVTVVQCAACTREGTFIQHPDGSTSGDGIVAEQVDRTIETLSLADGARALWRVLTRLAGGLTRIVQWLGSSASRDEKPCVESLRCDHEETRDRTVQECDDPSCDLLHVEQVCVDCGAHLGWRDAAREELEMLLPGDRFEGPLGRIWAVDDPWLPVESTEGMMPCILLEAHEKGGEWCIESEKFAEWVEDGTFSAVNEEPGEESVAESAEEAETVAADGGTPVGGDGLGTVVNRLQADFESALVWLHDSQAQHLTYYGKQVESLDTAVVSYLLAEGFEILDAGQKECPATGTAQASVEIRRAGAGNGGDER